MGSDLQPGRSSRHLALSLAILVLWSLDVLAQETDPAKSEAGSTGEEAAVDESSVPRSDEIVVTAGRRAERALEVPRSLSVVDEFEIQERLPQSTPEALEEEVGVVIQKTNQGGGSPIIRGRSGKDVLLLIDGQRFNDATFRRNNQYLNTIDLGALERLEIVRGPASVLYGSDAMGGAINLVTRRRTPTGEDAIGGRVLGQFESANLGWLGHAGLEGELGGFGLTGGYTLKRFGDLRAGSHGDPIGAVDVDHVQDPTGYREVDFSFSLTRSLSDRVAIDFLYLFSRQDSVPRSDRLIANEKQPQPPDLVREFDPQIQRWAQLRLRRDDSEGLWESLEIAGTFNSSEEARRRIPFSAPGTTLLEHDQSFVPGINAHATARLDTSHRLTTGLEYYDQTVHSSRKTIDEAAGTVVIDPDGRFPDGATYQSFGVFTQHEWEVSDAWTWTNGVRYSVFRTRFDLEGIRVGPLGPFGREQETFDDVTFSSGLSFAVDSETSIYGSFAKGFRAPNLDDLAVIGDFASGERVPNVDVDPETVLSLEVGAKHHGSRWRAEGSAAVAWYRDLLDNRLVFEQAGTRFFQIDNVGRAVFYSFEGGASYLAVETDGESPEHSIAASAFANIGHNQSDKEPASKVPPPQGQLGYRIDAADASWSAEAFARGALKQHRLSTADESDPRFPFGGTPSWWTFNLRGSLEVTEHIRVSLGLENLFDQRYRVHGSGIDAAGINAVVQLECTF